MPTCKVTTYELDNTPSQTLTIPGFVGLLDINLQGDAVYLYTLIDTSTDFSKAILPQGADVHLHIVRSDQEFDKSLLFYLKTIVINDIAYHFFSNYGFHA